MEKIILPFVVKTAAVWTIIGIVETHDRSWTLLGRNFEQRILFQDAFSYNLITRLEVYDQYVSIKQPIQKDSIFVEITGQ